MPPDLVLFPVPRSIDGLDVDRRHGHELRIVADPALPAQGFSLVVDDRDAVLRHADDAGRRYGLQTVEQLRDRDRTLPSVRLADHPDLPVRGVMVDVSRDRVPTRATLDRLVDALATCRFNHLQLYVEHAFAYTGHEEVWADVSPIDADDLRWLDARCRSVGIELAANQNAFGHLAPWLALDRHRHRAECPDGFEVAPGITFPPSVLAPTPDNAAFVLDLVREQASALAGRTVNVGCDETFELGLGASRERVEREGRAVVYLEHLRRIVEPLVAEGRTVQYWADIVAHHPEHLDLVPRAGTVALVWNYDGPNAPTVEVPEVVAGILDKLGIDPNADTRFAERLRPFADAGIDHWVAPGTSTWNSIVGRIDNARDNLLDAAEAGLASGAGGFLVTDWGDNGHHQPLTVSLPAIAYGGAVAWGVGANRELDVGPALDRLVFDAPDAGLAAILDDVGRVAARTGRASRNASPLFAALLPASFTLASGEPDPAGMAEVVATLDGALVRLDALEPTGAITAEIIEELAVVVELARVGARSLAAKAGVPTPGAATDLGDRADELDALIGRYRAAWATSSRPGGLDRSAAHLEAARDHLRSRA